MESKNNKISVSLYDMNKSLIAQMPAAGPEAIQDFLKIINDFSKKHNMYFMLLCKDISYYTVFEKTDFTQEFTSLGQAVITCITEDIGDIVSVEVTQDESGIEIWVKDAEKEVYCFYLFPYDKMMVFYKG